MERKLTIIEKTANDICDTLDLKGGILWNKTKKMLLSVLDEEVEKYKEAVKENIYGNNGRIGIHGMQQLVAENYQITIEEMRRKSRKRERVEGRQVCHWMARNRVVLNDLSLVAIGKLIGGQDHATVLHSVRTINNLIETNRTFRERIMVMCNDLGARVKWDVYEKELIVTGYMKTKQDEKVSIEA